MVTGDQVLVSRLGENTGTATCPSGDIAISGSYEFLGTDDSTIFAPEVFSSYPSDQSWIVTIANPNVRNGVRFRVQATCAPAT